MLIRLLIALIFILIGTIYYFYKYKTNKQIDEEMAYSGLMAMIFTAYCYLFAAQAGFINVYESVFVQMPYMFLMYAGTKRISHTLRLRNDLKESVNIMTKLNLVTYYYLVLNIIIIAIAMITKSNTILMQIKLSIILYTTIILIITIITINKVGIPINIGFRHSYTLVAWVLSLYEPVDYIVYYFGNYPKWGEYYKDITVVFDGIWILSICIILLFIPRVIRRKE